MNPHGARTTSSGSSRRTRSQLVRNEGAAAENLDATRSGDHLRQPVAGGKRRLEPLADEDPAGLEPVHESACRTDLPLHRVGDGATARRDAEARGEAENAVLDLADRMRVERERLDLQRAQDSVATGDGANLTEVLSQDDIWCQASDQLCVDGVQRASLCHCSSDGLVDLGALQLVRVDAR